MINILDKSETIEKYLKRLGQSVFIIKDGKTTEVFAVIEQTWKRNKSHFEEKISPIGRYFNRFYIYYGPASYDIRELGDDGYAVIDGEKYYFVQADCVKAGNTVQYFRGVLKKEQGGEGYENL
ncbi:MAG: hypothetical protein K6C14_00095 [Eubacterium sp.]|nr:hypothetical protein [Eubacterium sp.]